MSATPGHATGRPCPGNPALTEASEPEREAIIGAFRQMADYLEANPAAPLSRFGYRVATEAPAGTVRTVAEELGLPFLSRPYDYQTVIKFGPVTYAVWAPKARVAP